MTPIKTLTTGLAVLAATALSMHAQAEPLAVVYDVMSDTTQLADIDSAGNLATFGTGIATCCDFSGALVTRNSSTVFLVAEATASGIQALFQFDVTTGDPAAAMPLPFAATTTVLGLTWDMSGMQLLALTKETGMTTLQLNSVNTATGALTPVGVAITNCCAIAVGIADYDPLNQRWYVVGQPDSTPEWRVYTIDVTTGNASFALLAQPPVNLIFDGQLFAYYHDTALPGQRLATLDPGTGAYSDIGAGLSGCCFVQPGVAATVDDVFLEVARVDLASPLTIYTADPGSGAIASQMTVPVNSVIHGVLPEMGPIIVQGRTLDVPIDEDNTPTAFALSLDAIDSAGGGLTWAVSSPATLGVAGVSPGTGLTQTVNYIPNADENGMDSFDVTVTDTMNLTDTITVNVIISPVNDAPSFVPGADPMTLEDAGAQSIAGWATSIDPGATNEAGQVLTFSVTNDNNALFAAQPTIAANGTLSFTSAPDAFGSANLTIQLMDDGGTANGGMDSSPVLMGSITILSVNDAPSFTPGGNQAIVEDAGPQIVANWASGMSAGPANEGGQGLNFLVSTNNDPLFSALPQVDPVTGTLTYTPAPDAFGTTTVSVQLMDDGGIANGGVNVSPVAMFTIDIAGINDAPSFTIGSDPNVLEDAGPQTLPAWASNISPGPGEGGQTLTFNASNDNNALFSVQPSVAPDGTLTFTSAPDANGSAILTLTLMDDGGTANGGVDISAPQMVSITVGAVNDAPSFVAGPDQNILEDAGAQSVPGWATGMSAGPPNESGQALTFNVATDNDALFSALPAIDATTGDLTYTAADNAFGAVQVTVELMDDGGTVNGGVDTSPPATFMIDIGPVNDPPTFDLLGDLTAFDHDGETTIGAFVSNLDPGPNEGAQTLVVAVTNVSDPSLFDFDPALDNSGTLTFTPRFGATGIADIEVTVMDDGGTANGGMDTTVDSFTITVFIGPRIIPTLSTTGMLILLMAVATMAWISLRRRIR